MKHRLKILVSLFLLFFCIGTPIRLNPVQEVRNTEPYFPHRIYKNNTIEEKENVPMNRYEQFRDVKNPNRVRWGNFETPDLSGWIDDSGVDCTPSIEKEIGDKTDVLQLDDQNAADQCDLNQSIAQVTGTVEFTIRTSDVSKTSQFQLYDGTASKRLLFLIRGSFFQYYDGAYHNIIAVTDNTTYHVSITFDAIGTWTVNIDGVPYGPFGYQGVPTEFDVLSLKTITADSGYQTWFDDLSYSWDNAKPLNGLVLNPWQDNMVEIDGIFYYVNTDGTDLKVYSTTGPYEDVSVVETLAMGGNYTIENVASNKFDADIYFGIFNSNKDLLQLKYENGSWASTVFDPGGSNATCIGIWKNIDQDVIEWVTLVQIPFPGLSMQASAWGYGGGLLHSYGFTDFGDFVDQGFHGVNYNGDFWFVYYDGTEGWLRLQFSGASTETKTDLPSGLSVPTIWDINAQYMHYNGEDIIIFTNEDFFLSLSGADFTSYEDDPQNAHTIIREKSGFDDIISYVVWSVRIWDQNKGGSIERIQNYTSAAICGYGQYFTSGNTFYRLEFPFFSLNRGDLLTEVMQAPDCELDSFLQPFTNQFLKLRDSVVKSGVSPIPYDYKFLNDEPKQGVVPFTTGFPGWTVEVDTDTYIGITDEKAGMKNLILFQDASNTNRARLTRNTFASQINPSIEFWWTYDTWDVGANLSRQFLLRMAQGGTAIIVLNMNYGAATGRIVNVGAGGNVVVVATLTPDVKHHFLLELNDTTNTFNITIDDVDYGGAFEYNNDSTTGITTYRFETRTNSGATLYQNWLDAIWESWVGGEVGVNQLYNLYTLEYQGRVKRAPYDYVQYQYQLISGVLEDLGRKTDKDYTDQKIDYIVKDLIDSYCDHVWYGRGTNKQVNEFTESQIDGTDDDWDNVDGAGCESTLLNEKVLINDYTGVYETFDKVAQLFDNGAGNCDFYELLPENYTVFSGWIASDNLALVHYVYFYDIGFVLVGYFREVTALQWYDGVGLNNLHSNTVVNTMYHWACKFDYDNDTVDWYINGVYVSTQDIVAGKKTIYLRYVTGGGAGITGWQSQIYRGYSLDQAMNTLCSISPLNTALFSKKLTGNFKDAIKWAAQYAGFVATYRPDDQMYLGSFTPNGQDFDELSEEYGFLETGYDTFTERFSIVRIFGGYVNGIRISIVVRGEPNFGYWQDTFTNIIDELELLAMATQIKTDKNVTIEGTWYSINGVSILPPGTTSLLTITRRNITSEVYNIIWNEKDLVTGVQNGFLADSYWIPDPTETEKINDRINQNEQTIGALGKRIRSRDVLYTYIEQNQRNLDENLWGFFNSLTTGATLNSGSPINTTAGCHRILFVVNVGSDVSGTLTITGTTRDRTDTSISTPADTEVITIAGLSTVPSPPDTDAEGNIIHSGQNLYMSDKWFEGAIVISTTNLTITDVDVYGILYHQYDSIKLITLQTFDFTAKVTNSSGWFYMYLYLIEKMGDKIYDIENIAAHEVPSSLSGTDLGYRRRKDLNKLINGNQGDGIWAELFFGPSPSTYWVDINIYLSALLDDGTD